ncbi:YveK family protein [Bacillus sp. T3]|uniref:YveK family protein n=1 Tax=Bacillus sp. T3 TaxID=467262 RepID=UPI0029819D0B|nr:Wzz/FepE/Etk N-terminal domain-containing protein [Bacillus sp. T3]
MKNLNEMNYKAKEIDLKEIFNILKKRIWIILLVTIIATVLGLIYNSNSTTFLYQTSTRLIIEADSGQMKTLQVIIKDTSILEKVVEELKLNRTPESLANQITIQSVDESQVVSINVIDSNPQLAVKIANTTAKVFKEEVPKIVGFTAIKDLSDAKVNKNPINQKSNQPIILAFVIGLVTGIGIALLIDSLDDSFRSERELEDFLGLPVLGRISHMNKKNIKKKSNHHPALNNNRGESIVTK